ncbi:hypothetical protein SALBM311S_07727 [Streptomyces alboniger]
MSRTSSFPGRPAEPAAAARKVSRASSAPARTWRSTPVSVCTRARTSSALVASRTAEVANGSRSSTPLSSAAWSASRTTPTSLSTPSGSMAPSVSRSWARRSSTLCEWAGRGHAPGCASTTSRCTVFDPTSRTPSHMYGTLLPAKPWAAAGAVPTVIEAVLETVVDVVVPAVVDAVVEAVLVAGSGPATGDLPWTGAKDEKGEERQDGQNAPGFFAGESTEEVEEGPGSRREGPRFRARVGGVS